MLLPELASMQRYAFALAKDHALEDDIVQDALVLAMERRASFREGAPVRSWVQTNRVGFYASKLSP